MLLAKTLRSSTFKLALIWIGIFGALVLALLGYVYSSTAAYVRERADRAIAAEQTILRNVYDSAGRDGLIAAIKDRLDVEDADAVDLQALGAEGMEVSVPLGGSARTVFAASPEMPSVTAPGSRV